MRASILNMGGYQMGAPGERGPSKHTEASRVSGEKGQKGVQLAAPGPVV
jgi:hypothetical protein